jgi:acetylornithine deacetylase/succinyl-diaminopimelate desuccinylase-like protein
LPGQDPGDVLAALQRTIDKIVAQRPGLSLDVQVKNRLPAAAIPVDHPLVQNAARWARAVTGEPWPIRGAGPANEGYMLIGAGIPTLCGFGPRGGNAHAPDEWVATASLSQTLAVYAGLIHDYLTSGRAGF